MCYTLDIIPQFRRLELGVRVIHKYELYINKYGMLFTENFNSILRYKCTKTLLKTTLLVGNKF